MGLFLTIDPFGFGHTTNPATTPPTLNWGNNSGNGANDSGDDVTLGQLNASSPSDPPTGTIVEIAAPENVPVYVWNDPNLEAAEPAAGVGTVHNGLVGAFGWATALELVGVAVPKRNIGVAASTDGGGVGAYGITGSTPVGTAGIGAQNLGIGVVGRAMQNGSTTEDSPLETLFDGSVGVLGTSDNGVGVRGHAGPLVPGQPGVGASLGLDGRGGLFSAGFVWQIFPSLYPGRPGAWEVVSTNPLPQVRLVPSVARKLPFKGHLGDLYARVVKADTGQPTCQLFLCVRAHKETRPALWAPFLEDSIWTGP